MKKCYLIVRDMIFLGGPATDDDLKRLDCYYESTFFSWDGSFATLDAVLDGLHMHFINWTAELVVVE